MENGKAVRVGIISDTHGLLRAEVVKVFSGVKLIYHAGDIDTPEVLNGLKRIAPVVAVRGNMDRGGWADQLHTSDLVQIEGVRIYILHNLEQLGLDPYTGQVDVIVNGHTHLPLIQEKNGLLYFNPGSAGYRRNNAFIAVGILTIDNGRLHPEIIKLNV
jgi:putative phosphoesterase